MLARLWPRFPHPDGARRAAHSASVTLPAQQRSSAGPWYLREASAPPRLTRFCPIQPGFLPISNARPPSSARHVAFRTRKSGVAPLASGATRAD